jgi:hypothetical protein
MVRERKGTKIKNKEDTNERNKKRKQKEKRKETNRERNDENECLNSKQAIWLKFGTKGSGGKSARQTFFGMAVLLIRPFRATKMEKSAHSANGLRQVVCDSVCQSSIPTGFTEWHEFMESAATCVSIEGSKKKKETKQFMMPPFVLL